MGLGDDMKKGFEDAKDKVKEVADDAKTKFDQGTGYVQGQMDARKHDNGSSDDDNDDDDSTSSNDDE